MSDFIVVTTKASNQRIIVNTNFIETVKDVEEGENVGTSIALRDDDEAIILTMEGFGQVHSMLFPPEPAE